MISFVESDIETSKELLDISSHSFLPSKEDRVFDAYQLLKHFADRNSVKLFLSHDQERLCGYISLFLHPDTGTVDIGPMYILPEFQGRGFGRQQVEFVINWAKENKYQNVFTKTWGKNTGSRKIFEGLGFTFEKEKPDTRIDGDSTVSYRLNLLS